MIKEEPKLERRAREGATPAAELSGKGPEAAIASHRRLALVAGRRGHRRQSKARAIRMLPWIAAGVLAIALAALALWAPWRAEKPVDRPLVRLDVDLGADVSLPAPSSTVEHCCHLSRWDAAGIRIGQSSEAVHPAAGSTEGHRASGNAGGCDPFFSPDGQWVGFYANGKLNKISVEGGAVVPLADVGDSFAGASLGRGRQHHRGRSRTRRACCGFPPAEARPRPSRDWPTEKLASLSRRFCPEAKRSCFRLTRRRWTPINPPSRSSRWRIATGRSWPEAAHPPGIWPHRIGAGHLVYVNKATLFAIPFDPGQAGDARDGRARSGRCRLSDRTVGAGQFDFSRRPRAWHFGLPQGSGGASGMMTLQWVDASRQEGAAAGQTRRLYDPSLSPDGKRVALRSRREEVRTFGSTTSSGTP